MATEAVLAVPQIITEFPPLGTYELLRLVEKGLPTDCLELLKQRGLTFTEIGQLVIPPRTLKHRKARGERLNIIESERFLRVIRVLDFGLRVFGNSTKLLNWLRAPDVEMENRPSMSLLGDEAGARLVEGQLWGIADGIFS